MIMGYGFMISGCRCRASWDKQLDVHKRFRFGFSIQELGRINGGGSGCRILFYFESGSRVWQGSRARDSGDMG